MIKSRSEEFTAYAIATAVIALALFFGPWMTIWSINTLFDFGIVFNWKTWLSILWLQGLLISGMWTKKTKK